MLHCLFRKEETGFFSSVVSSHITSSRDCTSCRLACNSVSFFLTVLLQYNLLMYSLYSEGFVVLDVCSLVRLLYFKEDFLINVSVNPGQVVKLLFAITLRTVDFTGE